MACCHHIKIAAQLASWRGPTRIQQDFFTFTKRSSLFSSRSHTYTMLCSAVTEVSDSHCIWIKPSDVIYDKSRLGTCRLLLCRYLHSISSTVVASQICEIPRNSTKIRTCSSSKSSKVIDPGVTRKCICNFLYCSLTVTMDICYRFQDIDALSLKIACFSTQPLLGAP